MPKGMFTQGVCVLLDRPATLDDIESALGSYDVRGRRDGGGAWEFGGPTVIVAYRPEENGLVAIDTVDKPWPDAMGDPKDQSMVFGAWSMGHFGPFTFPGNLERAAQHSWTWEPGKSIADRHKAFLRIRSSYAFGAKDDAPVLPADYEPYPELEFVTKLASALLEVPGALCYFNPGGEILRDQDGLRESLNFGWSNNLPPFDIWSNVRLFKIDDEWTLMDTVGNGQLDLPDIEACFHSESYDCGEIDNFLRNITLYLLRNGEVIDPGDTIDGPGGARWQSHPFENGLCDPPRRVLRFLPQDDREIPEAVVA
jgi:hypothetical protein